MNQMDIHVTEYYNYNNNKNVEIFPNILDTEPCNKIQFQHNMCFFNEIQTYMLVIRLTNGMICGV